MKNVFTRAAVIFLALFAILFLGRDMIVKAAVGGVCHAATGLDLRVGGFHSNPLASTIDIREIKLFNPRGYSEKIMFHLPEVYVAYDLGSILAHKPHLREVRLHVAELVIERNQAGKLNLSELKPSGGQKSGSPQASSGSKPVNVTIDTLKLRVDKVVYKDFSHAAPMVQEFNLNIDNTYRDIKDVRALAPIILSDVLKSQALGALVNFRVGDLLQNFQASGVNVADLGLDKISGVLNSGLGQTAQGVVGSVADQLGSLFGAPKKK